MSGHWFCSTCNDIVTMHAPAGRWDSLRDVLCPVCHHETAFWVKDIPTRSTVSPERARQLFKTKHPSPPVPPERARALFQQMRANFEPGDKL